MQKGDFQAAAYTLTQSHQAHAYNTHAHHRKKIRYKSQAQAHTICTA